MDIKTSIYSFKIWLTVIAISFVLFQIPLYYLNSPNIESATGGYRAVFENFVINWLYIVGLLILPWLFVFKIIRSLFQPYWSARGFKVALTLVSEFLTLFMLVIYFSIINSSYIIPTGYVIAIFVLSNALGVAVYNYQPLRDRFFKEEQEKE